MKSATLHLQNPLRTRWTHLLSWLGILEKPCLSKKENLLARLTPKNKSKKPEKVDWTKSAAVSWDRSKERMLTAEEVASLLDENKGNW